LLVKRGVLQHCGFDVWRLWYCFKRHADSTRDVSASAGTLGVWAQHLCGRSTSARLVWRTMGVLRQSANVASTNLNVAGAPAVVRCSSCQSMVILFVLCRRL
jgi:hypothetical protein